MSWKRTIFAAIAFLLACAAFYLDVRIKETRKYQSVRKFSLADGIDVSAVGEIELKNSQGKVRIIKTGPSAWKITEPFEAQADAETIETLLINVTSARRNNDFEVDNVAEYGLSKPDAEVTLLPEKGKQFKGDYKNSFTVHFGHAATYTGQVYGRYPDKQAIFTVGEHVKNAVLREQTDFRRTRLLNVDAGNLDKYTAVTMTYEDKRTVLRNDVGRWKITEPINSPAEPAVVNEFLNKVGLLRVSGFLTQASDRPTSMAAAVQALASTSPTLTFTLEGVKGPEQKLVVAETHGVSGPVLVAQRAGDPDIMVLRPETVADLFREGVSFRTRELFTLKPEDVGLFTFELGRDAKALIRNDQGKWEVVGDPDFRLNQFLVNERLAALLKTRIKDYTEADPQDLKLYGLDAPRRKYAVVSKDKSKTEAIEIGRSESGVPTSLYTRRTGDTAVFTIDLSPELTILLNSLAERHFLSVSADGVERVEVEVEGNTYKMELSEGEWKIQKPGQPALETVDMRKLSALFEMLHVIQYERDITGLGDKVIARETGPSLSMRVLGKDNRELLNFSIGRSLGKTVLITVSGKRIFEVDRQSVERLYGAAKSVVQ